MLEVDQATPPSDLSYPATLAALSRNASVISTSSSDSGPVLPPIKTSRPRPARTFSSPRSKSPHSKSPKPPSYLAKELGFSALANGDSHNGDHHAKARSKSRPRNAAVTPDDFHFGTTLGEGSYSTVMTGTHIHTGRKYAVKVLDKSHLMRNNKLQTALVEKNALVKLGSGHPGVVRLYYTFHDEWSLYFVLDLAPNGEMQTRISRLGSLSTTCARYYTAQIIDAIDYMHQKDVIHRDLKPENLLLDEAFRIKIADFGTAKLLESGSQKAYTFVGTAQYVSPELLESNETSKSSDFWSLGCIIYQMISGRFAFQGLSEYLTWQKIKRLEYTFPPDFDEDAKDLVQKLLVRDPLQRLGMGEPGSSNDMQALRRHPFIASINLETLWTDPAPPLEAGLVKREITSQDQAWEDAGAAWDALVDDDEDGNDFDEIPWAADGTGPAYAIQRNGHTQGSRNGDYEDIGPMGEVRRRMQVRANTGTASEGTATIIGTPVGFPTLAQPIDISTTVPSRDSPLSGSPSSSSEGSPVDKLDRALHSANLNGSGRSSPDRPNHEAEAERVRGRNKAMSPVQGNGPPSNLDFIEFLRLPEDEEIIFNSTVEARALRRRASRLLPLPVPPGKSKTRHLVLTNRRLFCMKQRQRGSHDITVKSELALRASEKLREKDKEKESRGIVAAIERKGEREFVVMTSTKTYSYAAETASLADSWVDQIDGALALQQRTLSQART